MSTLYTTNSENIYFLNDKNIVQGVSETTVRNAVPAYSTFIDKYNELVDSDITIKNTVDGLMRENAAAHEQLSSSIDSEAAARAAVVQSLSDALSAEVDALSASLSAEVDALSASLSAEVDALNQKHDTEVASLSAEADRKFVLKSGDTIASLNVSGKLKVDGDVLVGKSSTAYSNVFVWNGADDEYAANSIDGSGSTFNVNPAHGASGVFIGSKTLSSIISEDVALTAASLEQKINGVDAELKAKYALSADVSAVSKLANDAGYLAPADFKLTYDDTSKALWLSAGSNILSVDATNFIVDGLLSTVTVEDRVNAAGRMTPHLVLTFNTYVEGQLRTDTLAVDMEKLVDIYTPTDGSGVTVDSYKIGLDYSIISCKLDVGSITSDIGVLKLSASANNDVAAAAAEHAERIQAYVDQLSGPSGQYTGHIAVLSSSIGKLSNELDAAESAITAADTSLKELSSQASNMSASLQTAHTDIAAGKEAVGKLEAYAATLDGADGKIHMLEHQLSNVENEVRNAAVFAGHIEIWADSDRDSNPISDKSLSGIFQHYNLADGPDALKNGNMYSVEMHGVKDGSPLSTLVTASFMTDDGAKSLKLSHGDMIILHSHSSKAIELTDLIDVAEVLPSMKFDRINQISARADINFFWLSGGNNESAEWIGEDGKLHTGHAISGSNSFIGRNMFDWNELVNAGDSKTLADLSAELSTAILNKIHIDDRVANVGSVQSDLSIVKMHKDKYVQTVLSVDTALISNTLFIVEDDCIDAYGQAVKNVVMEGADLSTASEAANKHYVDGVSAALQNAINDEVSARKTAVSNLSSALSAEVDALSASLSAEVDALSASLSAEVDALSASLSAEVDALSASLSADVQQISAGLSTVIDGVISTQNSTNNNISTISNQINAISSVVSSNVTNIDKIKSALSNLSAVSVDVELSDVISALMSVCSALSN